METNLSEQQMVPSDSNSSQTSVHNISYSTPYINNCVDQNSLSSLSNPDTHEIISNQSGRLSATPTGTVNLNKLCENNLEIPPLPLIQGFSEKNELNQEEIGTSTAQNERSFTSIIEIVEAQSQDEQKPSDDVQYNQHYQTDKADKSSKLDTKHGEAKSTGYDKILKLCTKQFPSNVQLIQRILNIGHQISENDELKESLLNIGNKLLSETIHLDHSISAICKSSNESGKVSGDSDFSAPFETLLNVWKKNMVKKRETGKLSFEDEEMMSMKSLNSNSLLSLDFNYLPSIVFDSSISSSSKSNTSTRQKSKMVQKADDKDYMPSLKMEKKLTSGRKKSKSPVIDDNSGREVRSCRSKRKVYQDSPDISDDHSDALDEDVEVYSDEEFFPETSKDSKADTDAAPNVEFVSTDYGPEEILECQVVDESFDDQPSLILHKDREHVTEKSNRPTVTSVDDVKRRVITHSKLKHSKKYPMTFQCKPCGLLFKRKFLYDLHLQFHKANKSFKCLTCQKVFQSQSVLNKHAAVVHQQQKRFTCTQCDKTFKTETPLKYHMMKHKGLLPYSCSFCENRYPTISSRNNHQRTHSDEKPFVCDVCDKSFKTQYNLKKHALLHDGEKNFQCDLCGQTFRQKSTLTSHRRVHTGEKPYICDVCGKAFTQSSILNMHKRVHTGYKPHKCTYCDSAFSCRASLRKHTTIHTGEKNFMCKVCGRCFSRAQGLKHHERSHTGVKPYSCKECGKCFTCPKHVKRHMLMHTGEFPYSCHVCGKLFRQDYNMKVHMRIHSGDKPFACTNCGRCFAYKQSLQMHGGHCVKSSGLLNYDLHPVSEIH